MYVTKLALWLQRDRLRSWVLNSGRGVGIATLVADVGQPP